MYGILWQFQVRKAARARFVRIYGPKGAWARLFRRSKGYIGTRLLQDPVDPLCFFTVDLWASRQAHERARRAQREDYRALDRRCEELTRSEKRIGTFAVTK